MHMPWYESWPLACVAGWWIGSRIRKFLCRPRVIIDKEDGSWATVNGGRLPMFCPKCEWPRPFTEKLKELKCRHCGYTGAAAQFDKRVSRERSPRGWQDRLLAGRFYR